MYTIIYYIYIYIDLYFIFDVFSLFTNAAQLPMK